jgi:hypothetical protein
LRAVIRDLDAGHFLCLRKNRTLNEVSLEEPTPEREPGFPREIADAGEGPAEIYEQQEQQRILSQAMNQLSSELRAALVLRLDDQTLAETAEVFGRKDRNTKGQVVSSTAATPHAAHTWSGIPAGSANPQNAKAS